MSKERFSPFALVVVAIASISGLLFGYHTAVISGTLIFLAPAFQLSPFDEGMVVSTILLGGLVGAIAAGELSERLGRKITLIGTAIVFILGALIMASATSYAILIGGRVVSGVAAGIASVTAPMYLAEVSPPHYRGRCVAIYQLSMSLGILLAYVLTVHYEEAQQWRLLFAWGAAPAVIQVIALFMIPETPSWCVEQGYFERAKLSFQRLRRDVLWKKNLKISERREKGRQWGFFFSPRVFYVIVLGVVLSILQQVTGINAVVYYTPKIFLTAGISSNEAAFMATMGIGGINVIATLISVWLLDRAGRRRLLLIGTVGMGCSLILVTAAFLFQAVLVEKLVVLGLMAYVAFFALSFGPVTWVVISEIFPLKVRSQAIALALAANWMANYLVSLLFPNLIAHWGGGYTFAVFTLITFLAVGFIARWIPETKGKSLEEIETMVLRGKF